MSFVSGEFLLLIGLFFVVYFLLGHFSNRYQWYAILATSLIYYIVAMKMLSVYMLMSITVSWLCARGIQATDNRLQEKLHEIRQSESSIAERKNLKKRAERKKKSILAVAVGFLLGILIVLKCKSFVFGEAVSESKWFVMPLGISFFMFLNIGYCIDVYRGTVSAEKNILQYMLYISYFPHVGQGPLDRYEQLMPQLRAQHVFNRESFRFGLERMLIGYFKKLVIANNLRLFIDPVYSAPENHSGIVLIVATLMYAFQIYADFSGYMDIACGISQCIGIELTENFRAPYFSKSIAEFWRRWHISLGAWFRDYLYYSLLRSSVLSSISKKIRKRGHKKAAQNLSATAGLFLTWLLIGFWHGTSGNYIAHGLFHGGIIIVSTILADYYKMGRTKLKINEETKIWSSFRIFRTFMIVCIGYILFRSENLEMAFVIYGRIINSFYYDGWSVGLISEALDIFYWVCMITGVFIMIFMDYVGRKDSFLCWINRQKTPVRWGVLYVFMLSVVFIVLFSNIKEAGAGNFIYYKF